MVAHPIHALRRFRFFRALSRNWDPMLPRRLASLAHPIYLRLLSHGSQIFKAPEREMAIRETFAAVLRALPAEPQPVLWDIGANIGWFSWHGATLRPDSAIVSFEPDAKNLRCLRRTARRWQLAHHTIVPCAVAECSGRAPFFVDDIAGATGTLEKSQSFNLHHYRHRAPEIEVETISLDDFLARGHAPPAVVKIDAEGAELRILHGAAGALQAHRPILFYESFTHRAEILALLKDYGYLVFDSDCHRAIVPETTNFVALPPACPPAVISSLTALGYPTSQPRG
ncbi:MAG: FkbM family methyltransferase [Spartobacteria bacterium]